MSIDFEHADDSAVTGQFDCGVCKTPIVEHYYQTNALSMCESCKDQHFAEKPGFAGYFRAAMFGFVGAILGAAVDLLVTVITGYQLGLIAIVMGWLVGMAVNLGARGRGGALFQILAMGFTYLSICGSLSGQVISEIVNGSFDEPVPVATASPALGTQPTPGPSGTPLVVSSPSDQSDPEPEVSASPEALNTEISVSDDMNFESGELEDDVNPFAMLLVGLGLCLALPVLIGMENPMTLLIYGFAIYQAWSMTKRVVVEGPFAVSDSEAVTVTEPGADATPDSPE